VWRAIWTHRLTALFPNGSARRPHRIAHRLDGGANPSFLLCAGNSDDGTRERDFRIVAQAATR
jgi:hypothetical protein